MLYFLNIIKEYITKTYNNISIFKFLFNSSLDNKLEYLPASNRNTMLNFFFFNKFI